MRSSPPDISAVLEHYGATSVPERSGWASMRCPFHHPDRTKSGSVNTLEGAYKCFTCGVKGDAWSIIMQQEGLEFRDAVKFGEGIAGGSDGDVQPVRQRGPFVPGSKGDRPRGRRYLPPGRRERPGGRT